VKTQGAAAPEPASSTLTARVGVASAGMVKKCVSQSWMRCLLCLPTPNKRRQTKTQPRMLDVALFSQDEVLVQKIRHALKNMAVRVERYEVFSQDTAQWRSRKFDLMVVHPILSVMDVVSTWVRDNRWAKPAAILVLVPENHMVFAPSLLDAGFDRCLPETVEATCLCAEIRALTRRNQGMLVSVSHYGALSFDHATQRAYVSGVAVDLTVREAQVLDILLKRVGQIIPKESFLQDIAPDNMAMNTTAAEVYIHRLRKKISHDLLPVRNIKRCGYLLPRYVDPSDSSLCNPALSNPLVDSVWPRYELVRHHLPI
jgi:two-component system, OmpR family, response regulator